MSSDARQQDRVLQPLTQDEEAVVRSLGRIIYALPRTVDADMMREQRLSLTEYLALVHLSEGPGRKLRRGDLAVAVEMTGSGMTRLADRLEKERLIQRVRSRQDARSWNAVLTDAGFDRLTKAWPTHLASVRRHFLDHLTGLDLGRLAAALRSIAT